MSMKNLRQLLRRPVRNCESEIRGEFTSDDTYVITTTCTHLKKPRVARHAFVGDETFREQGRKAAWEQAEEELHTHKLCSDPW
jgi:hypothetical protein